MVVPIATVAFVYAPEIVSVLFKHGAFKESSVTEAATFFRYLVLLLPFLAVDTLVARLLMAAQKVKEGTWFQTISNVVMAVLTVVFVRTWGPFSYPIAILVVYVVYTIALGAFVESAFPYVNYRKVLLNLLQLLGISGALAAGLFFLNSIAKGMGAVPLLFCGSAIFVAALGFVSGKLHTNDEIRATVWNFISSRRRNGLSY
jgi:peptidoglycan biosynthesis protein MviN/MurJ (putative lipid II flippase)